jgi:hypothetical protein
MSLRAGIRFAGVRFDVEAASELASEPRGGSWESDHLADSIAMYPGICVLDATALGRKPKRRSRS